MHKNNNKNFTKQFGARIAKLRKLQGFSQEKFAEQVNISQRSLSRIETGAGFAESDTIEKIAKVLDVKPADLFNFDDNYSNEELLNAINKKLNFIKNDLDKLRTLNEILQKFF